MQELPEVHLRQLQRLRGKRQVRDLRSDGLRCLLRVVRDGRLFAAVPRLHPKGRPRRFLELRAVRRVALRETLRGLCDLQADRGLCRLFVSIFAVRTVQRLRVRLRRVCRQVPVPSERSRRFLSHVPETAVRRVRSLLQLLLCSLLRVVRRRVQHPKLRQRRLRHLQTRGAGRHSRLGQQLRPVRRVHVRGARPFLCVRLLQVRAMPLCLSAEGSETLDVCLIIVIMTRL